MRSRAVATRACCSRGDRVATAAGEGRDEKEAGRSRLTVESRLATAPSPSSPSKPNLSVVAGGGVRPSHENFVSPRAPPPPPPPLGTGDDLLASCTLLLLYLSGAVERSGSAPGSTGCGGGPAEVRLPEPPAGEDGYEGGKRGLLEAMGLSGAVTDPADDRCERGLSSLETISSPFQASFPLPSTWRWFGSVYIYIHMYVKKRSVGLGLFTVYRIHLSRN